MITIEIVGRGSEFYFKKDDAENFDKDAFIAENGEDCGDWEEDEMDMMISLENGIQIYVNEDDDDEDYDIEDCFASDSKVKVQINEGPDWRTYGDAEEDNVLIIWGHSGVIGYSFTFENASKFDISKLEISGFKMPDLDSDNVIRYFGGITYNGEDPDEEEPNFEPKYGYWDAEFLYP